MHVPNETISSTSTSIQTPSEQQQRTREELSSTEASIVIDTPKTVPVSDEKSNLKVISEEIVSPIQVQTNEQQLKVPIQQNIVKEDVVFIPKETASTTQSHQQEATLNIPKSITDPIPPSSEQKQPISNTKINETLENNSTFDVKHSTSTPLQTEQQASEVTQTNHSLDSNLEQQKTSVPVQNASSLDVKPGQQQSTPEPKQVNLSPNLNLEQPQTTPDTVQNNSPLEQNSTPIKSNQEQEKKVLEKTQDTNSIDHHTLSVEKNHQPPVIDTSTPVPSDVVSDEYLSVPKESPTLIHKSTSPPPSTRILRSATSRIHQQAQAHHRHAHTKPEEPKPISTIGKIDYPSFHSLIFLSFTETTTTVPIIEKSIEEDDHSIESSSTLKPEEPYVETSETLPLDLYIDSETETQINNQIIEPIDVTDLPRQVHVHDPQAILDELNEQTNENENLLLDEQIENSTTVDSFLVNDHSPHLPRILENEEILSTIDSTVPTITNTPQTIETTSEAYSNHIQNDSKVNQSIKEIIFSLESFLLD